MSEILYNIDEKPDWEHVVAILQQFNEQEQNRIYGIIEGAQLMKSLEKEREGERGA